MLDESSFQLVFLPWPWLNMNDNFAFKRNGLFCLSVPETYLGQTAKIHGERHSPVHSNERVDNICYLLLFFADSYVAAKENPLCHRYIIRPVSRDPVRGIAILNHYGYRLEFIFILHFAVFILSTTLINRI